ncbi:MAG: hypothetical protein HY769_03440 [Candidatus Stahlbacteria bacterium]|nr:hypothetical protein [Candidatus Stahlbacteria bacterium]
MGSGNKFVWVSCGIAIICGNIQGADFIFRTKNNGIDIQPTGGIQTGGLYKFTVSTSGDYKILTAWFKRLTEADSSSQEIIRTNLQDVELQEFIPSPEEYITQFTSALSSNYSVLTAIAGSQTGDIVRAKIRGIGTQGTAVVAGFCEFVTSNTGGGWQELGITQGFAIESVNWGCIYEKEKIVVTWTTEGKLNTDKWIVSRGIEEETNYTMICEYPNQGNGYYHYKTFDSTITAGTTYSYRLLEVRASDTIICEEQPIKIPLPEKVFLSLFLSPNVIKNYVRIDYSVPGNVGTREKNVILKVYDLNGRVVKEIMNEMKKPGHYQAKWDCKDSNNKEVGQGVFFIMIRCGKVQTKKGVRVK